MFPLSRWRKRICRYPCSGIKKIVSLGSHDTLFFASKAGTMLRISRHFILTPFSLGRGGGGGGGAVVNLMHNFIILKQVQSNLMSLVWLLIVHARAMFFVILVFWFSSFVKVFVVSGFFIVFDHLWANMTFFLGFWRTPCGRSKKKKGKKDGGCGKSIT